MSEVAEITDKQVVEAVREELAVPESVTVGGTVVPIRALKRRWQTLFRRASFNFYKPEMMATDEIRRIIKGEDNLGIKNVAEIVIDSDVEADAALDEAAAVILASQIQGAEKHVSETVAERREWLGDNAETKDMRALVDAQFEKEKFLDDVGERWPARLVRFARLAGDNEMTADSVKRLLTNSLQSSPDGTTGTGT